MNFKLPLIALFAIPLLVSCGSDDPVIPHEEELITTVNYTLISEDKTDTAYFTFKDLDGDGGIDPIITNSDLNANTTYNAEIYLANELETPAEDITEEVKEEGDEHQFFYNLGSLDATVSYVDKDVNGEDLGLSTQLVTKGASSGKLTITLRHEPVKPNQGDLTIAGGETDIEVTFDVQIK